MYSGKRIRKGHETEGKYKGGTNEERRKQRKSRREGKK